MVSRTLVQSPGSETRSSTGSSVELGRGSGREGALPVPRHLETAWIWVAKMVQGAPSEPGSQKSMQRSGSLNIGAWELRSHFLVVQQGSCVTMLIILIFSWNKDCFKGMSHCTQQCIREITELALNRKDS